MVLIIFLFGCVLGSFFNVCIYRIPRNESIIFPHSHCINCKRKLKWYELIPIISYIFLKGRCRQCGKSISIRYPFIELLTAIIYYILFYKFGISIDFIKYSILFSFLIIASIIDIDTMNVYFSLSLVALIIGIVFVVISIIRGIKITEIMLTVGIPLIIFGLLLLLTRKIQGIGSGDLEIFLIISLYVNYKIISVSALLSIMFGGIISIILLLLGKRKIHMPFIPFITVGTFLSVLYSKEIIEMYGEFLLYNMY